MQIDRLARQHARWALLAAMPRQARRVGWAALAGMGVLLALVPGCSDDGGLGQRYSVSGTVTYKGKPVEQGTITFAPAEPTGRVAAGTIAGGHYSLTTLQPNDGALPGKYQVTILSTDVEAALASDPAARAAEDPQKRAAAAYKAAKPLVPPKYQLADTSKLTAEVQTRSNTFNFDLTD